MDCGGERVAIETERRGRPRRGVAGRSRAWRRKRSADPEGGGWSSRTTASSTYSNFENEESRHRWGLDAGQSWCQCGLPADALFRTVRRHWDRWARMEFERSKDLQRRPRQASQTSVCALEEAQVVVLIQHVRNGLIAKFGEGKIGGSDQGEVTRMAGPRIGLEETDPGGGTDER